MEGYFCALVVYVFTIYHTGKLMAVQMKGKTKNNSSKNLNQPTNKKIKFFFWDLFKVYFTLYLYDISQLCPTLILLHELHNITKTTKALTL